MTPSRPPTDTYHHGDLPNALRAAAVDVIDEKGVGHFSLREVARRAGVSHAAPAHHFGDTTGLLTSLAVEAMEHLRTATATAAEAETDPIERLSAVGRAYVSVAVAHPAHCEVMFRSDLVDCEDPTYMVAGSAAYAVLEDVVAALADELNPDLDRAMAAKLAWSSMQGLVVLHDNMTRHDAIRGRVTPDLYDLVTAFTRQLVEGLRAR